MKKRHVSVVLIAMMAAACGGSYNGKDGQDGKDGTDGVAGAAVSDGAAGENGNPTVFPQPDMQHHDNGNHYGHDKK